MDTLLVVVPAHNESSTIACVVKDLLTHGYSNILVIDDASTDSTMELAKEAGARVAQLPYNMGAWKATQAGIRYAHQHGYEYVVTFDADGQHIASTINQLIETYQKHQNSDIVIGSCPSRGSHARHIAWGLFRRLSGVDVTDLTSGLRLYNRTAISVLSSQAATILEYQDVGVLLLLRTFRLSKSEVQVPMQPRVSGISRIFYSWERVAYYMAYTVMLCISKMAKTGHFR